MKQYLGPIAALTLAVACARGNEPGATSSGADVSGNIAETGANQQTGASGSGSFFGTSGLSATTGTVSGSSGNTTEEASALTTNDGESGGVADGDAGAAVIDGSANQEFGDANTATSGMDGSATGCALNAVAQTLAGCDECVTCEQAMCCDEIVACINDATCSATVGCQDDCYNDDTLSPDEADMCANNCPGTSTALFVGYDSCNGGLCETACTCP
jgi:hypothetical protein